MVDLGHTLVSAAQPLGKRGALRIGEIAVVALLALASCFTVRGF